MRTQVLCIYSVPFIKQLIICKEKCHKGNRDCFGTKRRWQIETRLATLVFNIIFLIILWCKIEESCIILYQGYTTWSKISIITKKFKNDPSTFDAFSNQSSKFKNLQFYHQTTTYGSFCWWCQELLKCFANYFIRWSNHALLLTYNLLIKIIDPLFLKSPRELEQLKKYLDSAWLVLRKKKQR